MGSDGGLLFQFVLLGVLILCNAFFAASEMAIVSANDNKIKIMSDDGNKRAQLLIEMMSKPSRFLAAVQVGVTISGLLSSAIASESFTDKITKLLSATGVPQSFLKALSLVVITLVLSYFTLVFGELVPKRIAMKNPEAIALRVVGILKWLSTVFKPFVWLLSFSTNMIAKIFGVGPGQETNNVTEEEIRMLVDVGEESGVIGESEKEMINNVFEFNDRTAGDIMTHRTDIYAVENGSTLSEVLEIAVTEGYSRIPVFEDDLDNIIGIIYVKDLLKYVGTPLKEFETGKIMHTPIFVPESKRCQDLFLYLSERKQHLAVVVDEYGGTAGIVTMEDLLESIVGNIQDEYDHEEEEYSVIDESTYTIEGTTDLEEVERLLGCDLPEGDYDTLGGLIVDRLGRIPAEGEHPSVEVAGFVFTIEQVEDRRVEKVRAVKKSIQGH